MLVWWRGVVVLEKIFSFKKSFKIFCDYEIFAGIVFCTHKFFLNFEINFSQSSKRHADTFWINPQFHFEVTDVDEDDDENRGTDTPL